MKKTLNQNLEDDLKIIHFYSLNISSNYVNIQLHIENQPPSLLNSGDSYEEDIKLGFGRRPQNNSFFSLNTSSNWVNIQLHSENQPPSLLNSGDGYEEELKIRIWKSTLQYFSSQVKIKLQAENQLPMCPGSGIKVCVWVVAVVGVGWLCQGWP